MVCILTNIHRQIYLFLIKLLFFFFLFSCSEEDVPQSMIPRFSFTRILYLSNPEFNPLQSIGNSMIVEGIGYNGIVIYRHFSDEFKVYDANCPQFTKSSCSKLEIVSNIEVKCKCDESRFTLWTGQSLTTNISKIPLLNYTASYNSVSNQLEVRSYP